MKYESQNAQKGTETTPKTLFREIALLGMGKRRCKMFLRNEIDDRLVITLDFAHVRNIYETIIVQITESGWKFLSGKYRIGTDKATRLHVATVVKLRNEGKANPNCACGRQARQFSRIANAWLCEFCWDIEVDERR